VSDNCLTCHADSVEAPTPNGRPPVSAEPAALLVDIRGLSQLLSRSTASLWRDESAGRLPAGLRIGSSKRWRVSEIIAWTEAGCPDRRTWEAIRSAQHNGRR
jgi:predicted DNA-binding transcriptional regulator AlpA